MLTEYTKEVLYQGAPFTQNRHKTRCLLIAIAESDRARTFDEPRRVVIVRWDGRAVPSQADIAAWMGLDTTTDTLEMRWLPIPVGTYGTIRDTGHMGMGDIIIPPGLQTATGDYWLDYKNDGPLALDTDCTIVLTDLHTGDDTTTKTYPYDDKGEN